MFAQYECTQDHVEVYNNLLKLNSKTSQNQLALLPRENGITLLLEDLNEIIVILTEENYDLLRPYQEGLEHRLTRLEKLDHQSPYYKFVQAELYLHSAAVKLYLNQKISGFLDLRHGLKLLEDNHDAYPDFVENKKSLGLLLVAGDLVPEEYQWAAELIGFSGDMNKGLRFIEECGSSSSMFSREAQIYQVLLQAYILKNGDKAITLIENLDFYNRDNLLIRFLHANILYKNGENTKALELLRPLLLSDFNTQFYFLDYLKAELYLNKGDYGISAYYYREFIQNHEGKNYTKSAYLKLYFAELLGNRDPSQYYYFQQVLNNGQELADADNYAQRYCEKEKDIDTVLLKARFLCDGGYYHKAKTILEHHHNVQGINLSEKEYRLAIIELKLNNKNAAIKHFTDVLKQVHDSENYIYANSALKLALIYIDQEKFDKASTYINKCLTFHNFEYQKSIRGEAKALKKRYKL